MYHSRFSVLGLIPALIVGLLLGLTTIALEIAFWSGGWLLGLCGRNSRA